MCIKLRRSGAKGRACFQPALHGGGDAGRVYAALSQLPGPRTVDDEPISRQPQTHEPGAIQTHFLRGFEYG